MKAKISIAIGALAAIATQPASGWSIETREDVSAGVLDDQHTSIRYLIHAELHGPLPLDGLEGFVEPALTVKSRVDPGAIYYATLELRSLTHPDVAPATNNLVHVTNQDVLAGVSLEAWLDCPSDPCVEDYELVINRPDATSLVVDVFGSVLLQSNGKPIDLPEGTSTTLTIEGPL